MKAICLKLTKKVCYLVAALVILAAVFVVIGRVLTPYLDARRPQIESWASKLLHTNITIEKAGISWYRYEPGVVLRNVTVRDDDGNPNLQLRQIKVFFSIPESIIERKPVYSGVMVSGAELNVDRSKHGSINVKGVPLVENGLPVKSESGSRKQLTGIFAWLMEQPRIILRDIDVTYQDKRGNKRYFTLYNLKIANDADEHAVSGKAILHQSLPTEVMVAAHFTGNEPDLNKLAGKVYLNIAGLTLSQWLNDAKLGDWQIENGLLSTKVWATWGDGTLNRIQGMFQILNARVKHAKSKRVEKITRLSGDIGWKKEGNAEVIAGDDILIDWSNRLWPVTSFYLKVVRDENHAMQPVTMNIGYLNIQDVLSLLTIQPGLVPDNVKEILERAKPEGELENIKIAFNKNSTSFMPQNVSSEFTHIKIAGSKSKPGLTNVSGNLIWHDSVVDVNLHTKNGLFTYPSLFDKPLRLGELTGKLQFMYQDDNDKLLKLRDIHIANADVMLNAAGDVHMAADWQPQASINANFTLHHAKHVTRYLPMQIFKPKLTKWLNEAFLSGEVQSGSIVLRGKLKDFPFDHGNGAFIITGLVNNVNLHYAPSWPDITNISGKIKFSGRSILVDVDRATIFNVPVVNAHGEIPYLGDAKPVVLTVTSKSIATNFVDAMHFVNMSPLKKTLGRLFKNVELSGPINIILALSIPFEKLNKTSVNGQINIHNGQVDLKPWRLSVSKLQGKVDFTEKTTSAVALKGELFDKPLRLDLATIKKKNDESLVRAVVMNKIDLVNLAAWLKTPIDKVAKGSAQVTTQIDMPMDEAINITATSNLKGVAIDLPDEYAKKADEKRHFVAEVEVGEGKPLKVRLSYAELLRVAMLLETKAEQYALLGANLHLGSGVADWPKPDGLYISGKLKELSWQKVQRYSAMRHDDGNSPLKLQGINVSIGELMAVGITLQNVNLAIKPIKDAWDITVKSEQISGNIDVPTELSAKGIIKANLTYLNIDALSKAAKSDNKLVAKDIPEIDIKAKLIEYQDMPFSNVKLHTTPTQSGLAIDELSIQSNILYMDAKGSWVQSGDNNSTRIKGIARTPNVSDLLEDLDFDAHNFVAQRGRVNFNFSWSKAPNNLSLETINGQAALDIGKGRIVEINKSSDAKMDLGRMLNLFSLQTIPRRLSLDFSDMFEKGYSFDYLRGDFEFKRGDIKTSNMSINGPIAKVDIKGRIGLARHDFDLRLNIKPYVTSSMPVAATLITGQPAVGVAVWAVNKLIGGQVSKAAAYTYSVKGPWSKPIWKELKQKARQ